MSASPPVRVAVARGPRYRMTARRSGCTRWTARSLSGAGTSAGSSALSSDPVLGHSLECASFPCLVYCRAHRPGGGEAHTRMILLRHSRGAQAQTGVPITTKSSHLFQRRRTFKWEVSMLSVWKYLFLAPALTALPIPCGAWCQQVWAAGQAREHQVQR